MACINADNGSFVSPNHKPCLFHEASFHTQTDHATSCVSACGCVCFCVAVWFISSPLFCCSFSLLLLPLFIPPSFRLHPSPHSGLEQARRGCRCCVCYFRGSLFVVCFPHPSHLSHLSHPSHPFLLNQPCAICVANAGWQAWLSV